MRNLTDEFIKHAFESDPCSDEIVRDKRSEWMALSENCDSFRGKRDDISGWEFTHVKDRVDPNDDIIKCSMATSTTYFWLVKSSDGLKVDDIAQDDWFEKEQRIKEAKRYAEERASMIKANQKYCDKIKHGSEAVYGRYLSSEHVANSTLFPHNSQLKEMLTCECYGLGNKCDRGNRCVTIPFGSRCIFNSSRDWMCNTGFFQLGERCLTSEKMTEACQEHFGYGFYFMGTTINNAHECIQLGGSYEKKYLNIDNN